MKLIVYDFVIRTVVNRSANKVYIIKCIDRRLPLEDIARARDMDLEELIEEVESIVGSGTRLNIDYYIRQTIDEDKIYDIYTYFKRRQSQTRSTMLSRSWPRLYGRRSDW